MEEGGQQGALPLSILDGNVHGAILQNKIKRVGQILFEQDGAFDEQFVSLFWKSRPADNVTEQIEVPFYGDLGTDSEFGFEQMESRGCPRSKPQEVRGEFNLFRIAIMGGVINAKEHEEGSNRRSEIFL